MLLAGSREDKLRQITVENEKHAELRVEDNIFWGMRVHHDHIQDTLNTSSHALVDDTLLRFNTAGANTVPTPNVSGMRIEEDEEAESFNGPFFEQIGVLLYLSNTVRPDVSFDV